MVIETKFDSIAEIAGLQRMAQTVDEQVLLRAPQSNILVDAKSFLGLFTLDFSKPVEVVTDSVYVIRQPQESRCAVTSSAPQPSGGSRRSS